MIKKINDELTIARTITLQQLQQLAEEGFESVLHLRSTARSHWRDSHWRDTQQDVEQVGLCYATLPVDLEAMTVESALRILQELNDLAKPTLVYCNNEMLAAAIVLMQIAMYQGETLQQAFKRAEKIGLFRINLQPLPTVSATESAHHALA